MGGGFDRQRGDEGAEKLIGEEGDEEEGIEEV